MRAAIDTTRRCNRPEDGVFTWRAECYKNGQDVVSSTCGRRVWAFRRREPDQVPGRQRAAGWQSDISLRRRWLSGGRRRCCDDRPHTTTDWRWRVRLNWACLPIKSLWARRALVCRRWRYPWLAGGVTASYMPLVPATLAQPPAVCGSRCAFRGMVVLLLLLLLTRFIRLFYDVSYDVQRNALRWLLNLLIKDSVGNIWIELAFQCVACDNRPTYARQNFTLVLLRAYNIDQFYRWLFPHVNSVSGLIYGSPCIRLHINRVFAVTWALSFFADCYSIRIYTWRWLFSRFVKSAREKRFKTCDGRKTSIKLRSLAFSYIERVWSCIIFTINSVVAGVTIVLWRHSSTPQKNAIDMALAVAANTKTRERMEADFLLLYGIYSSSSK